MSNISKVLRFFCIYGPAKTWFKVVGRSRSLGAFLRPRRSRKGNDIGVIGCGQFAFATVGYSLARHYGNRFVDCFDVDREAQRSFADFYRIKNPAPTATQLIEDGRVKCVYVTSNHASHVDYAVEALNAGKVVYIEKPIAVSHEQFAHLLDAIQETDGTIYAGYNRPFSRAVRDLRGYLSGQSGPLTLNCFVSGHKIPPDHWYRDPKEGTRICGNVGHWLDLAVHILSWRGLPDALEIRNTYSSETAPDDDVSISITSSLGDLIVILLTARSEPFEGINETINLQFGDAICKIDDFRAMTIWLGKRLVRKRYWPKDVGHEAAILQPFEAKFRRDWNEVVNSTSLMLHIAEMVRNREYYSAFSFHDSLSTLTEMTDKVSNESASRV